MKRSVPFLIALVASLSFALSVSAADSEKTAKLATHMHEANREEIELGQVAAKKGLNAAVRDFGQQMVIAHKEGDAKLLKAVEADQVPIGKVERDGTSLEKLSKKTGLDYDRAYIDLMIDKHTKLQGKLQNAQEWAQGEFRKVVDETATAVNHHLMIAKQIEIDLKAMK